MMPLKFDIWRAPYRLAEIPGLGDRLAFVNRLNGIVAVIRRDLVLAVREGDCT
jgi:hypothetical protein